MSADYQEIAVPDGMLAEVVTHLEMRAPPPDLTPSDLAPCAGPWRVERRLKPDLDWYLGLYRTIGAAWLWQSRLVTPRGEIAAILRDPGNEVYVLRREAADVGLLELDFRVAHEVQIAFFGVAASEIGGKAGHCLMRAALARAWRDSPSRVWLHTCTHDHPHALPFYLRHGFRAYRRTVGIFPDPRLLGVLSKDAAFHIPVIGDV